MSLKKLLFFPLKMTLDVLIRSCFVRPDVSHTLFLCCALLAGDCGMSRLHSHFVLPAEVESYHTGRVHGRPWLRFCTGRLINSQNASRARKRICPSGSVRSIIHLKGTKIVKLGFLQRKHNTGSVIGSCSEQNG